MDKKKNHISPDVQYLEQLVRKRKGGSDNIRGIALQIIYSTFRILHYFGKADHHQIQLEGLEDIDIEYPLPNNKIEIVQIKHSKKTLTPTVFWTKGILLHFLDVYLNNKIRYSFRLVFDMPVKHRHLENLFSGNVDSATLEYWSGKILNSKRGENLTKSDCVSFLKLISYESINIPKLYKDSEDLLTRYYGVNNDFKRIYFRTLLTNVLLWSAERKLITQNDLLQLLHEVSDSLSTGRANEAIEKHWVHKITFSTAGPEKGHEYFEGRSAQPYHISAGLPVQRPEYLKRIEAAFENKDVILIRGASGQGKSTLAWQASMNLTKKNFCIYELKLCHHEDHLNALSRFIEARVKEMERPVIVIDSLNKQVSLWHILAGKAHYLPVKFLVTSNREDWSSHAIDTTKISLFVIDIYLTRSEAKDIYASLKKNKRLKSRQITWQEAWRKTSEPGLLMEYIYLLTNGNIIEERLRNQIQRIYEEIDGTIMCEIIRVTSIADICNTKISKSSLWDYILSFFSPSKDRDQIFNRLALEYLISIDDLYLRGLHFVRSEYLVKILHQTISIKRSYINVLALLEKDSILGFLSNLPFNSELLAETHLFNTLLQHLLKMPPNKIVEVMNGLYANMAKYYWMANRKIFDEIIKIPRWLRYINAEPGTSPQRILDRLIELGQDKQSLSDTEKLLSKLPAIDLKGTIVGKLSAALAKHIESGEIPIYAENSLSLVRWLNKTTSVNLSGVMISGYSIIKELRKNNVERAMELAGLFYLAAPERYKDFANNSLELANEIRSKAAVENIVINNHEVRMYFLPPTYSRIVLHQKSIEHIHLLYAFYPFLVSFETISLPPELVPARIYQLVSDNYDKKVFHKQLIKENSFTSSLTGIWCTAIASNYSRNTVYDWFKAWYTYRANVLEILITFYYAVESAVEKDEHETVAQLSWLVKKFRQYRKKHQPILGFPDRELEVKLQIQLDTITRWAHSLDLMIMNLSGSGFYIAEENRQQFKKDRNLVFIGLKDMQEGFVEIAREIQIFIDMSELEKVENEWYKQFYCASVYVLEKPDKNLTYKPKSGKEMINRYFLQKKKQEIQHISTTLDLFKQKRGISIFYESKKKNESILLYMDYTDTKNYFNEFAKEVLFPIVSYPSFSSNNIRLVIIKDHISVFNCKVNIRNAILRSSVYELMPGIEKHIRPETELVDDIVIETSPS